MWVLVDGDTDEPFGPLFVMEAPADGVHPWNLHMESSQRQNVIDTDSNYAWLQPCKSCSGIKYLYVFPFKALESYLCRRCARQSSCPDESCCRTICEHFTRNFQHMGTFTEPLEQFNENNHSESHPQLSN